MNKETMIKLLGVLALAVAVVVTSPNFLRSGKSDTLQVGILQLMEHAALDSVREGFIDQLAELGYKEGEQIELTYLNAQADQSNLSVMSQQLVSNESDLIFAIATTAAQAVANETTEIPILTGAVTDLVAANLVESNEVPNTNVSGTSDMTPVDKQLELLVRLAPDTKTLGLIYNSSEVNSEILIDIAEQVAQDLGLETVRMTVTNTNDVAQNLQALVPRVDALYIPNDNTLASAMATVGAIAIENQLPVVTADTGMVSEGGLGTVSVDYYALGRQAGAMAARVFNGEDVAAMPVELANEIELFINEEMAEAIGIVIPNDLEGGE